MTAVIQQPDLTADLSMENRRGKRKNQMEKIAQFLFGLLDDIDTVGDIAKSDDKLYREMVERLHRKRFEVATTDGQTVTFHQAGGC